MIYDYGLAQTCLEPMPKEFERAFERAYEHITKEYRHHV